MLLSRHMVPYPKVLLKEVGYSPHSPVQSDALSIAVIHLDHSDVQGANSTASLLYRTYVLQARSSINAFFPLEILACSFASQAQHKNVQESRALLARCTSSRCTGPSDWWA